MSDMTFLDYEQVFGENRLDILKKYGTSSSITDFAIFMGGSEFSRGHQTSTCWWTKTPYKNNSVHIASWANNGTGLSPITKSNIGARPVLPYSQISHLVSKRMRNSQGILEVNYGEYPQTIIYYDSSAYYREGLHRGHIVKTGKEYTTNCFYCRPGYKSLTKKTYTEYRNDIGKFIGFSFINSDDDEFNKLIKFVFINSHDISRLPDGKYVLVDSPNWAPRVPIIWVKVEPITWLVDEKTGLAISKKVLFSGIPFQRFGDYESITDFDKTDIKLFMDDYFSKEIMPSKSMAQHEKTIEDRPKVLRLKPYKKKK